MIILLISLSVLTAERAFKVKCSANLGLYSGVSVGVGSVNPDKINQYRYINLIYYSIPSIYSSGLRVPWHAGVNYEIRTYKRNNTYFLLSGGLVYAEMLIVSADSEDYFWLPPIEFIGLLLPHVVVGVGYRINLGHDNHLFIEWDIGLKPTISNINLGVSF